MFNFLKKKKKVEKEPKVFEGRFITDEEIYEMTQPKSTTFIRHQFDEIDEMMKVVKDFIEENTDE